MIRKTDTCVRIVAMHKASGEECEERNWTSLGYINVCAPAQSCRSAAASFMGTEHAGHEELVDLMASGENVPRAGNTNGAKASFLIATVSSTRRTANVQERTDRNRTRTCSSMPQLSQACHFGAKPNRHDRYRELWKASSIERFSPRYEHMALQPRTRDRKQATIARRHSSAAETDKT